MQLRSAFFAAAFAATSLSVAPAVAPASPSGLAWDSVTRIVQNKDATALQQPGNFDADYATAASVQAAQASGGGIMGKIRQMEALGKNVQQMMQKGFADKHYIAGMKERVDQISYQKATITDCSARTVTTLDLARKTYRVVSMDQPSSGSSSGGGPNGPTGRDDGTKVAIDIKNTALGPKLVAGQTTNGFTSDTTFTETKPSGETHSTNADMVGYYTAYAHPMLRCGSYRSGGDMPSGAMVAEGMSMMSGFGRIMDAMASAGMPSDRLRITQSGPSIPLGKLSMYDAMLMKGDQSHSMAFVTERGNVRAIDANDAAFSVPSDFTKEQ